MAPRVLDIVDAPPEEVASMPVHGITGYGDQEHGRHLLPPRLVDYRDADGEQGHEEQVPLFR